MVSSLNAVTELGAFVILLMLVCPVAMGVMMLLMWRGMRHERAAPGESERSREPVLPNT